MTRLCREFLRPWRAAHRRSAEKDGGGGGRRNAPREEVEHLVPLALPPAAVGSAALSLTAPPPTRSVKTLPRRFYLIFLHLFLCVIISFFPTIALIVLIPVTRMTSSWISFPVPSIVRNLIIFLGLEDFPFFDPLLRLLMEKMNKLDDVRSNNFQRDG